MLDAAKVPAPKDWRASLLTLMSCPDLASKAWIWHQYDHLIMGNTAIRPQDGDAALVRVTGGHKGLAMTSDCTPRYVQAHPETGGRQAVAEAWRNITAVGATPLAVTDNMNFGNPQKPEIMGQFAGAIMGMAEACTALDFPVVSGNVSLYNETEGRPILPTPTIGAVGVIEDIANAVGSRITQAGLAIVLLGETTGWLGQSLYLRETAGPRGRRAAAGRPCGRTAQRRLRARRDRRPPRRGLPRPVRRRPAGRPGRDVPGRRHGGHGEAAGKASPCRMPSSMARTRAATWWRPTIGGALLAAAQAAGVPAVQLGYSGGPDLIVEGLLSMALSDLRAAHEALAARLT